jgi:hypothetical protein
LVEPLHGFTFAAAWCATVPYASRLALPGTEAKMQALINGTWDAVTCYHLSNIDKYHMEVDNDI